MLDVQSFFDKLSRGMVVGIIALMFISFWGGVLVAHVLFLTTADQQTKLCQQQRQQLTQELSRVKLHLAKCEEKGEGNDCGKIVRQKERCESLLKGTQARLKAAETEFGKSRDNGPDFPPIPPEARRLEIGSALTGRIAIGQVLKFVFAGKANTPVLIVYRSPSNVYVRLTVYGPDGRSLVKKRTRNNKEYPFTPQKSGHYTLEIKGLQRYGKFSLQLSSL